MPDRYEANRSQVEAIKLEESNLHDAALWCGGQADTSEPRYLLSVPTLRGALQIPLGAYLVKDISSGRFYGMDANVFEKQFGKTTEYPDTIDTSVDDSITLNIEEPKIINDRTRSMMGHPSYPRFPNPNKL